MFYRILHAVLWFFLKILYRFSVEGKDNIPEGGALICCNHTSLGDPIYVLVGMRVKDHPKIMAKESLFKFPPLRMAISSVGAFPVGRGKSDIKAIKNSIDILNAGNNLLIFPEGTRNHGETSEAKTGVALLALKSGKPIVPLYLTKGRKPIINKVKLTIGKPVLYEKDTSLSSSENNKIIAVKVMDSILALNK